MAAGEFFAGYITEYSLSVDNLFVFVLIMAAFRVPAEHQHRVLLVGIVIALVMRGVFIAVGAAAIQRVQLGVLPVRRGADRDGGERWRGRAPTTTRSSRRTRCCG